jgi:hypothetical protein
MFWLNSFPANYGISDTLIPCAIIVGSRVDYAKHCQLEFGSYVQTHEVYDNSMVTHTMGSIALHPTGNEQGGYFFLSLATGRVLNRNRWTALPMPAEVIDRVHVLARLNNCPIGLMFTDRAGVALIDVGLTDAPDDDSDDEDYDPATDSDIDADDHDDDDAILDSLIMIPIIMMMIMLPMTMTMTMMLIMLLMMMTLLMLTMGTPPPLIMPTAAEPTPPPSLPPLSLLLSILRMTIPPTRLRSRECRLSMLQS